MTSVATLLAVHSRPVFADPSGRRRRAMRRIGFVSAAALAICLGAMVVAMAGGPAAPFAEWAAPRAPAPRRTTAARPGPRLTARRARHHPACRRGSHRPLAVRRSPRPLRPAAQHPGPPPLIRPRRAVPPDRRRLPTRQAALRPGTPSRRAREALMASSPPGPALADPYRTGAPGRSRRANRSRPSSHRRSRTPRGHWVLVSLVMLGLRGRAAGGGLYPGRPRREQLD